MKTLGFEEVILVARDVRACAAFYRDVVGLAPESEATDDWAWFRLAEEPAQRLGITTGPLLFEEHSPRSPGEAFGGVHFAIHVPREEIDPLLDRVRRAGHEVHGPKRFDSLGATSWYVYDPGGHLPEFWVRDERISG
jgi:catechol 2,3-dioxygenase-like lactoylglutathione lyase family enzyme